MVYLVPYRLAVSWATAPPEQALEESLDTLAYVEALRDSQIDDTSKAEVFSVWADAYSWLAGRLLDSAPQPPRREELERAFEIAERYRARVLLEKLQQANAWPAPSEGHQAERLRRLELQRRKLTQSSRKERAELRRVAEARTQLEGPATAASITSAVLDPSTLAELEETLADDEALLSFQIAPWKDVYDRFAGGSWLFAVSRGSTEVYRLGDLDADRKVGLYLGLLQSQEQEESVQASLLFEELLQPALDDLPEAVDKLMIVPDGSLFLLPFGSLRRTASDAPLSASYQISVLPSATLWLQWRQDPLPPATGAALVLADPTPPQASSGEAGEVERSWPILPDRRFDRLPGARKEGENILRLLGEPSLLRIDGDASETFLKRADLAGFDMLHIASHAIVDTENPDRSAVLLAAESSADDGKLEVREIVGLSLSGRAVVLAACDSASGSVLQGEGVMSLARAFFQAGARTVVAGLWRLGDDELRDLFAGFYDHLATGQSVAAALQAAQTEALSDGRDAADWAGLVVLGDGSLAPLPGAAAGHFARYSTRWAAVGLVVYLIALGYRVWRHQRQ